MDRIIGFIIFTTVLISCTFFSAELPKADPFEKGPLNGYDGKKLNLASRRSVGAIAPNDNEVD